MIVMPASLRISNLGKNPTINQPPLLMSWKRLKPKTRAGGFPNLDPWDPWVKLSSWVPRFVVLPYFKSNIVAERRSPTGKPKRQGKMADGLAGTVLDLHHAFLVFMCSEDL